METSEQLTIYDALGLDASEQDEGRYPAWVEIPGVRDWTKPEPAEGYSRSSCEYAEPSVREEQRRRLSH